MAYSYWYQEGAWQRGHCIAGKRQTMNTLCLILWQGAVCVFRQALFLMNWLSPLIGIQSRQRELVWMLNLWFSSYSSKRTWQNKHSLLDRLTKCHTPLLSNIFTITRNVTLLLVRCNTCKRYQHLRTLVFYHGHFMPSCYHCFYVCFFVAMDSFKSELNLLCFFHLMKAYSINYNISRKEQNIYYMYYLNKTNTCKERLLGTSYVWSVLWGNQLAVKYVFRYISVSVFTPLE